MRERGLCLRRKFTKIFTVTKLNGLGCCNVKVFSVVARYGALENVPPRLTTISFLVYSGVNLTANYLSIVQSVRSAGADVNNSQVFQSVLH